MLFTVLLTVSIFGCAHNNNKLIIQDKNTEFQKSGNISSIKTDENKIVSASFVNNTDNSNKINSIVTNPAHSDKSVNIIGANDIKECPLPVPVKTIPIQENNTIKTGIVNNIKENLISDEKNSSSKKKSENVMDEALDYCQMSQELWQNGELDNALEALDQAYSLILSVDTNGNGTLAQQKEDIRFTISKRILEIYASRNFAVNGNHKAIPIEINSHIQAEINLFTSGIEKSFFRESLKRSGIFSSQIIEMLRQAGLPVELSWLPLIESGFKVNALSSARALGLWQFIPSTGYKFGLKRDLFIDERLDPIKSTEAAIAYLKELHRMFGDWSTVLAAYNCGEGRVLRVIRDQNINYLDNFWDLYGRLPRETARYVPRFIATLHILSNRAKYGLDDVDFEPPLEYESVKITKQVHIKDIAREICVDEAQLKRLNPELRYGILPPYKYLLNIPRGKGEELLAKIDSIPLSSMKSDSSIAYYKVKRGETLSMVARKYRVSVQNLMRANKLRKQTLVAGKMLKIPYEGTSSATEKVKIARQKESTTSEQTATHTVKSGESLWIIANRYNTTTKNIQELNNMNAVSLHVGQVLYIQKQGNSNQNNEVLKKYRVKSGDNLFRISQKYKMPLGRLLHMNKLTPKSKIHVGQYIYVE